MSDKTASAVRLEERVQPPLAPIVTFLLALLWMVIIGLPAVLIALTADSGRGRLFAFASLAIAFSPFAAGAAWRYRSQRWRRIAVFGGFLALVLAVAVVILTPGRGTVAGHLVSQRETAETFFSRLSPSRLLPEGDQLLAGMTILPALDPLFTLRQSKVLKQMTRELYRELEQDRDFREVGSSMGYAYEALLSGRAGGQHCYVYVPASLDRNKPAPLLVFFHGAGGNFKAYLWILARLADRAGIVVAAPTGGAGNWRRQESEAALRFAQEVAGRTTPIDEKRIHIAGLSNGGKAVSQLMEGAGPDFVSTIFISPVFDEPAVESVAFAHRAAAMRLLVISGSQDDRVPERYVKDTVTAMEARGITVRVRWFANADHFLIFSQREPFGDELFAWLNAGTPAR